MDTPGWLGWVSGDRDNAYRELEHPADLLLEITGPDLATLFDNALFAFYDQVAELDGFRAGREVSIVACGASPAEALRALLSEALYRFETEGFVAVGAEVALQISAPLGNSGTQAERGRRGLGGVKSVARLWGENAVVGRHTLVTEIKAVTYHRLSVEPRPDGTYRATVLFDI